MNALRMNELPFEPQITLRRKVNAARRQKRWSLRSFDAARRAFVGCKGGPSMSFSTPMLNVTVESAFTDAATLCNPEVREAVGATLKLAAYAAFGGAAYGFTMGLNHPGHPWLQAATSAAKVP